jgi:hypothetical protein
MEWVYLFLALLALAFAIFTLLFVIWRLITMTFWAWGKSRRGAMSRGRIAWSLLGGLGVILVGCFAASAVWQTGEPSGDFVEKFTPFFLVAAGMGEFAVALRAAFARRA